MIEGITLEEWRDITGYEGYYQVSSKGNVRSLDRVIKVSNGMNRHIKGRTLITTKDRNGYVNVGLNRDNKAIGKLVHRFVANAFIPNKYSLPQVNHIDHNRDNNDVSNLEWCTAKENSIDMAIFNMGSYVDSHNTLGTHRCIDCGKLITYKALRCKSCATKLIAKEKGSSLYKNKKPLTKEEINSSLTRTNGNFTESSKDFNMTDNALRKWCRKYDLPTHSREWK